MLAFFQERLEAASDEPGLPARSIVARTFAGLSPENLRDYEENWLPSGVEPAWPWVNVRDQCVAFAEKWASGYRLDFPASLLRAGGQWRSGRTALLIV